MSFLKTAIYLALLMITFNLIVGFVGSLDIFPVESTPGTGNVDDDNILTTFTGLRGGMEGVWALATATTGIAAVGLSILTRTWIPTGVHLFSVTFWTAYTKSNSILSIGGYIPDEFLGIFFGIMVLIFIAAVIAILTGVD